MILHQLLLGSGAVIARRKGQTACKKINLFFSLTNFFDHPHFSPKNEGPLLKIGSFPNCFFTSVSDKIGKFRTF